MSTDDTAHPAARDLALPRSEVTVRPVVVTLLALLLTSLACAGPSGPEPAAAPAPAEVPAAEPAPRPARPLFPLAVGHRWTWTVSRRTGAGPRVLLIPTQQAEEVKLADWEFRIHAVDGDRYAATLERTPVDGLPSTTAMTLFERDGVVWMDAGNGERPALEALVPPNPLSVESVPCVAHLLGGVVGTCAAAPGGPLGTPPGLDSGVVGSDIREGAEVGQVLVGLMTAGIFIPGNRSTVESAVRTSFTPGPGHEAEFRPKPSPLLAAIAGKEDTLDGAALAALHDRHGPDVESLAAAMLKIPAEPSMALPVLPSLAPDDRLALARVVMGAQAWEADQLASLARMRPLLGEEIPADHRAALLARWAEGPTRDRAALVLDGTSPPTTAVIARIDGPFDDDVVEAVTAEAEAHPWTLDDARATVGLCSFDEGRGQVVAVLLPRFAPDRRAAVVAALVPMFAFDDGKLALLREHQELLRQLPVAEREALAEQVTFDPVTARDVLGLPPAP